MQELAYFRVANDEWSKLRRMGFHAILTMIEESNMDDLTCRKRASKSLEKMGVLISNLNPATMAMLNLLSASPDSFRMSDLAAFSPDGKKPKGVKATKVMMRDFF